MRHFLPTLAVLAFALPAAADEPKKLYCLENGQVVERMQADIRNLKGNHDMLLADHEALRREVAELRALVAGAKPAPVTVLPVPKPVPATVIPAGYHAHTKIDGTTIVHADSNFGDPVAHAGVPYPWPKTGFPGQVVAGPCPGGVCPTGTCPTAAVAVSTAAPATFSASYAASYSVGRPRLFARVLAWRPRFLARLGAGGDCP